MKKFTLPLAAVALVGLYAGTASAQCAFNSAPAKGVKGSMVRNYAKCPGTEHPSPNTQTQAGTDACTPVTPHGVGNVGHNGTDYIYGPASGPKGKCSVQTQAKLVKDCSTLTNSSGASLGLPAGACHVTFVKSKCSGIYRADGITPINSSDDGWQLATLSRTTFDDRTNGDMTVIDFPVTFAYSTPNNGSISVNSSSAAALVPLVGANNSNLPPCTSIETVNVTIKAPGGTHGKPFAKLGGATRP
ncbi:MAG TPA: hypothetical protein VGK20_05630 [Candidatus Binatia bacterium]|jgi:hypothetical protein